MQRLIRSFQLTQWFTLLESHLVFWEIPKEILLGAYDEI